MEESNNTPLKKPLPAWATPVSIIVAGLLIGAGIFFKPTEHGTAPKVPSQAEAKQDLISIAKDTEIKGVTSATCFTAENKAAVQEDVNSGKKIGVQGTPFLVFEFVEADGIRAIAVPGAIPREAIEQIIKDKKLPQSLPETPLGEYTFANEADHKTSTLAGKTVRIVEYSDLDCPYCKRIHPELEAVVANNENVVWIYRHFPLTNLHPNASIKAEASECVAKIGGDDAFWKFIRNVMAE